MQYKLLRREEKDTTRSLPLVKAGCMFKLTDERAVQAVKAALRWMKTHRVEWLKTEEKIYSRKYEYAGTMDGLAYVDSCGDPACCTESYKHRMCLVDWKTSNHLSTIYCLQTA